MYNVYYVVIDTGIRRYLKNTHTHIKNNIWYGNELSEYDAVQSTVLVDGRRYLTVVRRLIAVSIGDIREW